ncbi:hypothetical protein Tco_1079496 [Tanacetum coccineum]|uniref:Uncharacterized protein n=1 Tax=Tanacetum coccineum TaxID=301880 RepID=A0ABQ5HS03_9ASTR
MKVSQPSFRLSTQPFPISIPGLIHRFLLNLPFLPADSSISASGIFHSAGCVQEDIPSGTTSLRRSGRQKTFTKKKASSTPTPTLTYYYIEEGDPDAEYKQYLRYASDEGRFSSVDLTQGGSFDLLLIGKVLSTDFGLGEISILIVWADGSELRLHYQVCSSPASGLGLDLWGSLRNLIAASETYDASIVWHDQDQVLDPWIGNMPSYSLRTQCLQSLLTSPPVHSDGYHNLTGYQEEGLLLRVMATGQPCLTSVVHSYSVAVNPPGAEDIDLLLETGQ